jgi:hypothetical protein
MVPMPWRHHLADMPDHNTLPTQEKLNRSLSHDLLAKPWRSRRPG